MPTTRKLARKTVKTTPKEAPVETVSPAKVVTIQVSFIVSTGSDDKRTIAELQADLKAQMLASGAKNVTAVQGYYIIRHGENVGKVCLPNDYDPETEDFLPGRRPPLWALTASEQEKTRILERIERESGRDKLSKNPPHLRTAEESKRHRAEQQRDEVKKRLDTPGAAMADFYENTPRGREIMAEREAAIANSRASASDDEFEDIEELDEDEEQWEQDEAEEIEDVEDEWEVEDINDDEKMEDAVEEVATQALTKIRARRVIRK